VKEKKRAARDRTVFCISNNKLACSVQKKENAKMMTGNWGEETLKEKKERKKKEKKMAALISE
jgi:adenine-specific DNA glycosylase